MIIERIKNDEDGTEVVISEFYKGGYIVMLRDTDADESVAGVVYPTLEIARAKAKEIL